jgi:hypothetical protein
MRNDYLQADLGAAPARAASVANPVRERRTGSNETLSAARAAACQRATRYVRTIHRILDFVAVTDIHFGRSPLAYGANIWRGDAFE